MNTLHPEYVPDFSGVEDMFNVGGVFNASDVNLVRSNSALRDALNVEQNSEAYKPFVPCSDFDDVLPKDIQSTGEFKRYFDYVISRGK